MKRYFVAFCVASLLLCATARAQQSSRVDVGASVTTSHNLGYFDPNLGITSRLLLRAHAPFAIEGRFDVIPRAKKYVGNGHGYIFKADFHGFVRDDVSLVGGLSVYRQVTREFSSTDAGPAVGAAYWKNGYRFQAVYEPPIRSGNHSPSAFILSGEGIAVRSRFYLAVRPEVQVVRFNQDGLKMTGFRAGLSLSLGSVLER